MNLKNLGIALILLGGAGLIFIQSNTAPWYISVAVVFVGFFTMMKGDRNNEKKKK